LAREPGSSDSKRARANEIRRAIVAKLSAMMGLAEYEWLKTKWWCLATLAEAHFGLARIF
jgi:hypothetical protein